MRFLRPGLFRLGVSAFIGTLGFVAVPCSVIAQGPPTAEEQRAREAERTQEAQRASEAERQREAERADRRYERDQPGELYVAGFGGYTIGHGFDNVEGTGALSGINLGLNYTFRQGYSMPFYRSRAPNSADETADLGKSLLLVGDVGDYRLPNVHSVDGRISKNISYKRFNANFDVDIFNIFNSGTVLGRGYDLRLGNYNQVLEIMNPRIVRLGLRVGF